MFLCSLQVARKSSSAPDELEVLASLLGSEFLHHFPEPPLKSLEVFSATVVLMMSMSFEQLNVDIIRAFASQLEVHSRQHTKAAKFDNLLKTLLDPLELLLSLVCPNLDG